MFELIRKENIKVMWKNLIEKLILLTLAAPFVLFFSTIGNLHHYSEDHFAYDWITLGFAISIVMIILYIIVLWPILLGVVYFGLTQMFFNNLDESKLRINKHLYRAMSLLMIIILMATIMFVSIKLGDQIWSMSKDLAESFLKGK